MAIYQKNMEELYKYDSIQPTIDTVVKTTIEYLFKNEENFNQMVESTEKLSKPNATKDICELRNMINVGYLITRHALERKESRGLHYTIDYPKHAYDKK